MHVLHVIFVTHVHEYERMENIIPRVRSDQNRGKMALQLWSYLAQVILRWIHKYIMMQYIYTWWYENEEQINWNLPNKYRYTCTDTSHCLRTHVP